MSILNRQRKHGPALWVSLRDAKKPAQAQSATKPVKTPPRARRSARRRSKRMAKLMAYYRERKASFLNAYPKCAVYKWEFANQIHHIRGRAGTLLLDERFWIAVSISGHALIHDDIERARRMLYICPRGEWNTPPEDAETARLRLLIKELTK